MKRFVIKTRGCKTNQLESAIISEKLKSAGYEEVKKPETADIFILNSCSVTSNSNDEALRTLRHIKHSFPQILTVLTGCAAQLATDEIKKFDYINIFIGNDDKFDIIEHLRTKTSCINNIFRAEKFNNQFVHDYAKTRGYLKIQDGCNNYCSYCTIPLARGTSRSNSIENIVEQVNIYAKSGIKEVVLTGIHIGQWGEDINDSLESLLQELEKTEIKRYRLGSLNPLEMTENLLDFLAASKKFCPHFHLSLQSLNDKTLSDMNRHYDVQKCLKLIDELNEKFSLPFLGSDIIVGFPNESNEEFETTLKNAELSGLSNIHVFPYSIRANTKAAQMDNQIPLKIKKERAERLKKTAFEKFKSFINLNLNTEHEVLIEKHPDKKTGLLKGVTENYLNVFIDSKNADLLNTLQRVKIVKFEDDKLFCTII